MAEILFDRKRIVQRIPVLLKNHVRRKVRQLGKQIIPEHTFVRISGSTAVSENMRAYYVCFRYGTPDHEYTN